MSDNQVIDFFIKNGELFVNNSIIMAALREIGWFLFDILVTIADACESLYETAFGFIDFTSWSKVNEFVDHFKPLFIALMAVSLFALGIMLILNHEKKPKILINICIAILCVTCSTVVFQQMNQVVIDVKKGIDAVPTVDGQNDGVYDIVSTHLFDIYYLDQQIGISNIDFGDHGENLPHPNVTKKKMNFIKYSEVLDPDDDNYEFEDAAAEDILTQEVIEKGDGNGYMLRDIYNGVLWTSAGNCYYFRYRLDSIPAVLQLIAVTILYIALSYKCVRIIFELVFARLMAYLYSAELSGGQKIAKILVFIRDSYILLLLTAICVKLFFMLNAYIAEAVENPLIEALLSLFVAFCVIDGPNLVEKLLGLDAGLKSSTARMVALYGHAKSATRLAMAPGRGAYNYAKQSHMMNKQADATKNAINSAMAAQQNSNVNTDFMDEKQNKEGSSENQGDVQNNSEQKGNQENNAAFVSTGGQQNTENLNAGNDMENGQNPSFMDDNGLAGSGPDPDAADAAENQGSINTDFMDDNAAMDSDKFEPDMKMPEADTFMEQDMMQDSVASTIMPEASGIETMQSEQQMENKGSFGNAADGGSVPSTPSSVKDTGRTSAGDTVPVPDRFDQMMGEVSQKQNKNWSDNRVISQYKGHIFDRNMKDKK